MRKSVITLFLLSCMTVCMYCEPLINKMVFFPDRTGWPERLPEGVEEVSIKTGDSAELRSLLLRSGGKTGVLYLQGNAGNIADRIPELLELKKNNVTVLGLGYRGYGKSSGSPSEAGIYEDAKAGLDYLEKELGIGEKEIIVFGRSLGTAAAVEVSQGKDLKGLILVTPLLNAMAYAKSHGMGLFSGLVKNKFANSRKIGNLKCPLLIIHGTIDEVIPYEHGFELYKIAPGSKKMITIQGGTHNELEYINPTKFWGAIEDFLKNGLTGCGTPSSPSTRDGPLSPRTEFPGAP